MFFQFRVYVFTVRVFLGCLFSLGFLFLGSGFSYDVFKKKKIGFMFLGLVFS